VRLAGLYRRLGVGESADTGDVQIGVTALRCGRYHLAMLVLHLQLMNSDTGFVTERPERLQFRAAL
jgi:hypothetical protein